MASDETRSNGTRDMTLLPGDLEIVKSLVLARVNPAVLPWLVPGADGESVQVPVTYSDIRRADRIAELIDKEVRKGDVVAANIAFMSSEIEFIRDAFMLITWWQAGSPSDAVRLMGVFGVPDYEVVWSREGTRLVYRSVGEPSPAHELSPPVTMEDSPRLGR